MNHGVVRRASEVGGFPLRVCDIGLDLRRGRVDGVTGQCRRRLRRMFVRDRFGGRGQGGSRIGGEGASSGCFSRSAVDGLVDSIRHPLITVAASLVMAVLNTPVDNLELAERLSQVLGKMDPSPERDVVALVRGANGFEYPAPRVYGDDAPGRRGTLRCDVGRRVRRAGVRHSERLVLSGLLLHRLVAGGRSTTSKAVAIRRGRRWIRAERVRRGLREPLHCDLRRDANRRIPRRPD